MKLTWRQSRLICAIICWPNSFASAGLLFARPASARCRTRPPMNSHRLTDFASLFFFALFASNMIYGRERTNRLASRGFAYNGDITQLNHIINGSHEESGGNLSGRTCNMASNSKFNANALSLSLFLSQSLSICL